MDEGVFKTCLLLLNLPSSAFCGIDLLSFTASPRFVGIKFIPPGWHFVFVGANNSFSLRHGAWFEAKGSSDGSPEIFILKWNADVEELCVETDPQEVLRWRANLGGVWREGMTPYRQTVTEAAKTEEGFAEESQDWASLTNSISEKLLRRITGGQNASSLTLNSASSAYQDVDDIPGISQQKSREHQQQLGFLPVDLKQTWREGAVGRERTLAAQDRSWALKNILEAQGSSYDELLGEFQMAFIMVLDLNNNSCLEQWRRILGLVLTSKSATVQHPEFFSNFLRTLRLQMEHSDDAEGGLFDLSDEGGSLLRSLLKKFRAGLEQQSGMGKEEIMDELDELEDYLRSQHGWLVNESYVRRGMVDLEDGERVELAMKGADEDDEAGDYAPVVVDLTPEQAKSLGRPDTFTSPLGLKKGSLGAEDSAYDQTAGQALDEYEDQDIDEMDERY